MPPCLARFRLLTTAELLDLPEPSWLLAGLVPSQGLTLLYGPSGSGKSFVALDWALCVAAGVPWHGRAVEQRCVIYVAAEGRAGLRARCRAWLSARGPRDVAGARFLVDAVNLLDRAVVERARRTLETLPERPGLLVVDTMARTMVGGDETARDVGLFVHAIDALRDGGAAIVVHHTGHEEGGRERGSSALGAAADARLQLVRDGRTPRLTLTNPKQKDATEHEAIDLRLAPVEASLVVEVEAAHDARAAGEEVKAEVLAFIVEHGPASKRAVRDAVKTRASRADEALSALEAAGKVKRSAKGWLACPDASDTLGHAQTAVQPAAGVRAGGRGTKSLPGGTRPTPVSREPCPDDGEFSHGARRSRIVDDEDTEL